MGFTWILALLPVLQLIGQTISAEENLACGNLTPKYVFLLIPPASELPSLTKFLNTVSSAILVKNSEDAGVFQVFSDQKDWETIYRYTLDRGFYFGHDARCVDENEFSVSEKLHLPENSIDHNMIEGRRSGESWKNYPWSKGGTATLFWKDGRISSFGGVKGAPEVPRSSAIEAVKNEQRFQRLVREVDAKSNNGKDEGKKPARKNENKKKKGKLSRRRSSKKKGLKKGTKDGGSTTENPAAYKTTATKTRGGLKRPQKFQTSIKNVKTRRSVAETLEHERRSRATENDDDDDDDGDDEGDDGDEGDEDDEGEDEDYDENDTMTTENAETGKRFKKGKNNKGKTPSGKGSTKAPSGHKRSKSTVAPPKGKATDCKKDGKRCKTTSNIVWIDDDGKHHPEEPATDNPWYNEVDTDIDLVLANKVEYDRGGDKFRFQDCPPTVSAKPLGRLADYIYRIFAWVKKLESKKKEVKKQN